MLNMLTSKIPDRIRLYNSQNRKWRINQEGKFIVRELFRPP